MEMADSSVEKPCADMEACGSDSRQGTDLTSEQTSVDQCLNQESTEPEREQRADGEFSCSSSPSTQKEQGHEEQQPSDEDRCEEPKAKKFRYRRQKGYTVQQFMTGRLVVFAKMGGETRQFSHCLCPVCCSVFESKEDYDRHVEQAAERSDVCTKQANPDAESVAVLKKLKDRIFLTCPQCGLLFLGQKQMDRHLKWHEFSYSMDSKRGYICHECGKAFPHKDLLVQHLKVAPGRENCRWCGFRFNAQCQVRQHNRMHNNTSQCETCGQSFGGMVYAQIQTHKESHMPVVICEICGELVSTSKASLAQHKKQHDIESVDSLKEKKASTGGQKQASKDQSSSSVFCQHCGSYVPAHKFSSHERKHLGETQQSFPCQVCKAVFETKALLLAHMNGSNHYRYICEFCGVGRNTLSRLKNHQTTFHTEGMHQCGECDHSFETFSRLKRHVHAAHRGRAPCTCTVCGKVVSCLDYLRSHMIVHTGERPYKCPQCPSRFARRDYLKKHVMLHSGEKPFVCEDCGRGHTTRCGLALHMRKQHSDIKYPCELCDQQFVLRSSRDYHKRIRHPQHFFS